jgi:Spy/CpxP family protein refolding chaperone
MKRILNAVVLTLAFASSFAVFAQESPTTTQGAPQAEGQRQRAGRMGRMQGRRGMRGMFMRRRAMRALGQLNLSDAQRERIRSIHQSAFQSTQAKREELRQLLMTRRQGGQLTPEQEARAHQLRDELRATRQRTHEDTLAVLTPEQRTQVEKFKQERKARREEWRKRRDEWRGRRDGKDAQPPPQ